MIHFLRAMQGTPCMRSGGTAPQWSGPVPLGDVVTALLLPRFREGGDRTAAVHPVRCAS
jgi:hypothetical protein